MIDVVKQRIQDKVQSGPVVVFMKGSPALPQCGFSAQAVEALKRAGAERIEHEDVLADPAIRQGIKDFTGWPTIPQVFIAGEFVGGADIVTELYRTGELAEKVKQAQDANAA